MESEMYGDVHLNLDHICTTDTQIEQLAATLINFNLLNYELIYMQLYCQ